MISVFQTETGGYLSFAIPTDIPAASGYLDLVSTYRRMYRLDGILSSGYVLVDKELVSILPAGDYTGLPQVIDADLEIYFLDSVDVCVEEVPDFFSNVVLVEGSSLLERLLAVEHLVASGTGVTDHGALTGLGDDDHTQYLNDSRGDARYWSLSTDLATQTEFNTHTALTTSAHGGIVASSDSRLSDSRTPLAHANTHYATGTDPVTLDYSQIQGLGDLANTDLLDIIKQTITNGVTTSAPSQDAVFDALALLVPTSRALTINGTAHDLSNDRSWTVGDALLAASNLFTMRQDIRADGSGSAAGLHAPWITGDALPTVVAGSSNASNDQTAIQATSASGIGVRAISGSGIGLSGESDSSYPLIGLRTTGGAGGFAVGLAVRKRLASGSPTSGFGVAINWQAQTTTTADQDAAQLAALWSDTTDATRTSYLMFSLANGGVFAERARMTATGALLLRTSDSTTADGLHVPWISGDAHQTVFVGSSNASNNQIAINAVSNSTRGIQGTSTSSFGMYGISNGSGTPMGAEKTFNLTNTAPSAMLFRHNTSGTPAANYGISIGFQLQSTTTTNQDAAQIASAWSDATHASRTAYLAFSLVNNAASLAEKMRLTGAGALLIRSTDTTQVAGLNLPWITGDALPTSLFGSLTGSNDQIAGIFRSGSNLGVNAQCATSVALQAERQAGTSTTTMATTIRLKHTPGAGVTPAAGFGAAINIQASSDTTASRDMAFIGAIWTNAADASRTSAFVVQTVVNGTAAEYFRVNNNGLLSWGGNASVSLSPSQLALISNGGSITLGNVTTLVNGGTKIQASNTLATGQFITFFFGSVEQARFDVASSGASSAAVTDNLILRRNPTSGTPAVGTGHQVHWVGKSDTTADRDQMTFSALWATETDASRKARGVWSVYDTAAREIMRGEASGSAAMIGFLGATAVIRQTLGAAATDAGTTQTLANNLRTALINLGLGQT